MDFLGTPTENTNLPTTTVEFIPFGLDGRGDEWFYAIHIVPIILLSMGTCLSTILIFVFLRPWKDFYKKQTGERLVLYLAVCDLLYSIAHILDHAYMLRTFSFPPAATCAAFGTMLSEFGCAQTLVVLIIAFNAFVMVVREKRISYGKYDWRLLALAFGFPVSVCVLGLSTRSFGPSGPWCHVHKYPPADFPYFGIIFASVLIVCLSLDLLFYICITLKINRVTRQPVGSANKYRRSIRNMLLFMATYFVQYSPYVVFGFWDLYGDPPAALVMTTAVFVNSGGTYNFLIYLVIRHRKLKTGQAGEESVTA